VKPRNARSRLAEFSVRVVYSAPDVTKSKRTLKDRARLAFGHLLLKATRFRTLGEPPSLDKYVLIAAPHTSNWDLPVMLALSFVYDVKINWLGKHTLFEGPFGWWFRFLGGIPVVRHKRRNMVDEMADTFNDYEKLVLVVAPVGTRARAEYWKSGFYHIARTANVPIVCGFIDFKTRQGGFGPAIYPTGNVSSDMDKFRAFYGEKLGKYPEKTCPIRLRDESSIAAKAR